VLKPIDRDQSNDIAPDICQYASEGNMSMVESLLKKDNKLVSYLNEEGVAGKIAFSWKRLIICKLFIMPVIDNI
jgi:hypothetical protein